MKKVLWLKPTKGHISVGRYLLAEELRKMGYDIKIVEASGIDVFRAFYYGLFSDYDIIVGGVRVGAYIGYILSKIKRKPLVIDVTDPYHQVSYLPRILYWFFKKYEEHILRNSDAVIFVTKNYMVELLRKGITGVKVNNGVKFEEFNSPNVKLLGFAKKTLLENGIDLNKLIILYIGGLEPIYHIDIVLKVAEKLKDFNFVFIGEGSLKEKIIKKSKQCKNVFYLGSFEHNKIPGFVYFSDICLCLVNADQPLKLLEYGAASKPVITIHGELEERFTEREVYFINPTVKDLCTAISELAENIKLRKKYGLNLKKRVVQLKWSQIARKYDEILKSVLKGD